MTKQIKKGDCVKVISSGMYAVIGELQYEHNRYHLPKVSGWQYNINDLEKQSYESLIAIISQQESIIKNQAEEIKRHVEGWEVIAQLPMGEHPSETRRFAKKMLSGETPYKLNELEENPHVNP